MKSILLAFASIVIISLSYTSCSKDDKVPEKFSQKSVEENKQLIESSGIDMAQSMDEMKDQESVEVAVSFGERLDMADPFEDEYRKKSKVITTVEVIAGLQNGTRGFHDVFNVMKSTGEFDDPETIEEVWEEAIGIYTWNDNMEEWDYTSTSNEIVFRFPSTEDGNANNAELTISNYTGVLISNPIDNEYEGEIPVSLEMNLKVDGTTLISYIFSAKYSDDGIPESIASDLTIENFKFEVDLTNNDQEVSVNSKLKQGGEVIVEVGGSALGDFTQENIDDNTITHSETYTWIDYVYNENTQVYEEVEVTELDEWEELDVGEVVNSAKAKFNLFNIGIRGEANTKALINELDVLYPDDYWNDPTWDEEETTNEEARIINEYLFLYAVDIEENAKIAEVEAYVVKESDEWSDDGYNYWIDFRLIFGDESKIDLETYFEEGFSDFIDEVNEIIWELNGEYDLDMDPVDY